MAHLHNLAGQYLKGKSKRKHFTIFFALSSFGGCAFLAIGIIAGYFWHRFGVYLALASVLVMEGVIYLLWRPMSRNFDRIAKERLNYLRGGQGEALISFCLQDLDDDWHIFNNIQLEQNSDIDHVIVGPGGLYCISTKSHRGLFTGTPDGLLHNGKPSPFAQQALCQTMNIKDRLTAMLGNDVPWVQSILAVPLGHTEGNAFDGKVWLVHQDDICKTVSRENGQRKLTSDQITRISKALEMLQSSAAKIYQRPARPPSADPRSSS